jgi:hypothetical protein
MTKEEQSILEYFVDEMEFHGVQSTLIRVSFDDETILAIENKYQITLNSENRAVILKKLISHEYIQYTYMNAEEFGGMQITPKGVGVVNSLRAKDEQRRNRKMLKKISDAIEEHKGLATFIGLVITASIGIVTLILKLKGIE